MKKYSKSFLTRLYTTMLRIRICEEILVEPILKGEIRCPVHLCSGQEAIAAGVCAALTPKNRIFGNHRSHGHYLAKGGGLKELIAEIYGKEAGCAKGRGGSMHVCAHEVGMMGATPIVAGTISLAVGSALASIIRKEKSITVSFFGDGATGEGVLYESLNFAALKKLPVIFACENNLYSTHLPIRECRPKNNIFEIGEPFGIPSFRCNGNDVLEVYEATKKAVNICRRGNGPVFIEFMTYRLRGHVGPNDNIQGLHTDIRPAEELEKWRKKDPIINFERFLLENKILNKEILANIKEKVEEEVNKAHIFAKESPYPKESELREYVFKK
ncbi:MAG: thiamine pyrophosphate-dependent dehydrogenase E1 component subunit alpha [Nitrospirota bacterium]